MLACCSHTALCWAEELRAALHRQISGSAGGLREACITMSAAGVGCGQVSPGHLAQRVSAASSLLQYQSQGFVKLRR